MYAQNVNGVFSGTPWTLNDESLTSEQILARRVSAQEEVVEKAEALYDVVNNCLNRLFIYSLADRPIITSEEVSTLSVGYDHLFLNLVNARQALEKLKVEQQRRFPKKEVPTLIVNTRDQRCCIL